RQSLEAIAKGRLLVEKPVELICFWIATQLPAWRIGRFLSDSAVFQCQAVGNAPMHADMGYKDRMIWCHSVQIKTAERRAGKLCVIISGGPDPRTRGKASSLLPDLVKDVRKGGNRAL